MPVTVAIALEPLKTLALESAWDSVVGMDPNGRIIEFNPAAERMFGYTREQVLGTLVSEVLIPARTRRAHEEGLKRYLGNGQSEIMGRRIELEAMRADGTEFPIELAVTEMQLPSGPVFAATIRDISERRQMESALRESEERFRSLVQNSRDVIAVIDSGGICTYVSPGVEDLSGYVPTEIVGASGFEFIHPEDREKAALRLVEIVALPSETITTEVRTRIKGGSWIWIELRAANRLEDPAINGIVLNYHDITERKEAESRLRESERSLAEAQALLHIGSFTWDVKTNHIVWSDELFRIFGYEPNSVEPSYELVAAHVHPDDRETFLQHNSRAIETGHFDSELRVVKPDGSIAWIHARGKMFYQAGDPVRMMGTNQDITERKEAEIERALLLLREQELADQSRLILDSTGEGIFGVDRNGLCTFMNQAAADLFRGEAGRFVGESMHALTHHTREDGSPYPAEECAVCSAFQTGEGHSFENEVLWRLDGTSFPAEYATHPIMDPDGLVGAVVNFSNVTRRKKIEEDLRASEALFRGAFGAARTGIALIGADGRTYVDVNQALCEMLGYSREELLSLAWTDVTHPDDLAANRALVEDMMAKGAAIQYLNKRYIRKDGQTIFVEISDSLVRDECGAPLYFVTHVLDVTQRDKAAQALEESRKLLQAVVDNSPALIHIKDRDGVYLLANDKMLEARGFARDAVIGRTVFELLPHEPAKEIADADARVFAALVPVETEELTVHPNGDAHTYLTVRFPLFDRNGECYALCAIATDITDRAKTALEKEKLEGQLRQSMKMEAVGQLAGGVAHDFNNILAVILNYAEFLAEDLDPGDPRLADVQEIAKAGRKAAELVHQLLAFSRKEVIEPRIVDLNEVIADFHSILRRSLGEDIELRFEADPELPFIMADPGQLQQILLNFAVNSRAAMVHGGLLVISTGVEKVNESGRPGLAEGQYVRMRVTDTGQGMDKGTADRIFEPFFTTKERGAGTGLGLASVYGIVKQARGGVYVDSALDRGTTFSVYLPVTSETGSELGSQTSALDDAAPKARGHGTILVVEDEDGVRTLVERILSKQGFDVVSFAAGADALDYCSKNVDCIDLLVTDVVMPGMSGKTLSESLQLMRPDLETLYMSGYTDEIIAERGVLAGGEHLIQKPFKSDDIVASVRSLLDGS